MKRFFSSAAFNKPHKLYPVTARLTVPKHIPHPGYVLGTGENFSAMYAPDTHCVKSDAELPSFRRACRLAARARSFAGSLVRVGITPDEIDARLTKWVITQGGYPSPLGFNGFPKAMCSSVNQVVVHGIPDTRPLEDGDIVNFDVSVFLEGFHGDCSATFLVGNVDAAGQQLVAVTRQSLDAAVTVCAPGVPFSRIGDAIEAVCAPYNYGIVDCFTGHGIGREFHTSPSIFHMRNRRPGLMQKGMTFTIEPAINEGPSAGCAGPLADGWTYVTVDGLRSAQFEDVILITGDGAEVLTTHDPEQFQEA
jgi:methionyl aminopeptidase